MGEWADRLQRISTPADLAEFVERLADDLRDHPERWENHTLEDFLRSWSAWLLDVQGHGPQLPEQLPDAPTWRSVGTMLSAASTYE
jgi:hypothetical protein